MLKNFPSDKINGTKAVFFFIKNQCQNTLDKLLGVSNNFSRKYFSSVVLVTSANLRKN